MADQRLWSAVAYNLCRVTFTKDDLFLCKRMSRPETNAARHHVCTHETLVGVESFITNCRTDSGRAQDKEATVYVGNLDERVTDEIIWELMLNAGRIANVHLPKDRVSQSHQGYGFVEFATETDAEYAVKIMNQIRLWGKPIRVKKASADKNQSDGIGAELFIGNLDSKVDEMVLQMTFSRFGTLASMPKVLLNYML